MDKYDLEVERLTKNPEFIYDSWNDAEPLFQVAARNTHRNYGCLTQIRQEIEIYSKGIVHEYHAQTSELTKQIRNDERIPKNPKDIKVEDLPVFAEWQRKLDKELNRKDN